MVINIKAVLLVGYCWCWSSARTNQRVKHWGKVCCQKLNNIVFGKALAPTPEKMRD